jgi:hypothetical protein
MKKSWPEKYSDLYLKSLIRRSQAIEEAQNLSTIEVDEIIGSL